MKNGLPDNPASREQIHEMMAKIKHNSQGIFYVPRTEENLAKARTAHEGRRSSKMILNGELWNRRFETGYIANTKYTSNDGKEEIICGKGDVISFTDHVGNSIDKGYEGAVNYAAARFSSEEFNAKCICLGSAVSDEETDTFLSFMQDTTYADSSYIKQMVKDGLYTPEECVAASEKMQSAFCNASIYSLANVKKDGSMTYRILDEAGEVQKDFNAELSSYEEVAVPFESTKLSDFEPASTGEADEALTSFYKFKGIVCSHIDASAPDVINTHQKSVVNTYDGFMKHAVMSNHPCVSDADAAYDAVHKDGALIAITGIYRGGQLVPAVDPAYIDKDNPEQTAHLGNSEIAAVFDKDSGQFAYCNKEQILEICGGKSVSDFLENDDDKPILKEPQRVGKAERAVPSVGSSETEKGIQINFV